jgi:hypothetical protein
MITRPRCWIEPLSSLRDFLFWLDDLPSHKWLGYFQMPFEFENRAVIALGGIPNKVQVGDMGSVPLQRPPETSHRFHVSDLRQSRGISR